jgi:hypothetical protein
MKTLCDDKSHMHATNNKRDFYLKHMVPNKQSAASKRSCVIEKISQFKYCYRCRECWIVLGYFHISVILLTKQTLWYYLKNRHCHTYINSFYNLVLYCDIHNQKLGLIFEDYQLQLLFSYYKCLLEWPFVQTLHILFILSLHYSSNEEK